MAKKVPINAFAAEQGKKRVNRTVKLPPSTKSRTRRPRAIAKQKAPIARRSSFPIQLSIDPKLKKKLDVYCEITGMHPDQVISNALRLLIRIGPFSGLHSMNKYFNHWMDSVPVVSLIKQQFEEILLMIKERIETQ